MYSLFLTNKIILVGNIVFHVTNLEICCPLWNSLFYLKFILPELERRRLENFNLSHILIMGRHRKRVRI